MRHRQRGAYSFLFLVILIGGGLLVFALAADGARLYAQQRVLQQQADALAVAAAASVQTCGGSSASASQVCQAAQGFATAQGFPISVACDDIETGVLESAGSGLYTFTVAPFRQSNSVRVGLQHDVPRSLLLPARLGGYSTIAAESIARRELIGTFSAAPDLLALGAEEGTILNSILAQVLGTPVGLTLLDYQELRETTVGLGMLLAELASLGVGDGTLTTLLESDVPASMLLEALALAVGVASPLDSLLVETGLGVVSVRDIFKVNVTEGISEEARLPLYDVLLSVVLNLAEGLLIELPVDIEAPGLAKIRAYLITDEAPSVAMGPARQDGDEGWVTNASGADIRIQLELEINIDISVLGTGVSASLALPLSARAGAARGDFISASCAGGFNNEVQLSVGARTAVADIDGSADVALSLSLLGIPITLAGLRLQVELPVGATDDVLNYPPMPLHAVEQITRRAGEKLGLANLEQGTLRIEGTANPDYDCGVVCGLVNTALQPIIRGLDAVLLDSLLPLIGSVLDGVLEPIFALLGIELGTADITILDVRQSQPTVVRTIK